MGAGFSLSAHFPLARGAVPWYLFCVLIVYAFSDQNFYTFFMLCMLLVVQFKAEKQLYLMQFG